MEYNLSVLGHVPLFDGIPEDKYHNVLQCLDGTIKSFPAGKIILDIGEPSKQAGIVLDGKIQIISYDEAGNSINMNHCCAGECFGEAVACAVKNQSPMQISVLEDCRILLIRFDNLMKPSACPYRNQVTVNLLRRLAERNLFLNRKIRILAQKKLRDRIKLYLQTQPLARDDTIQIPFNRNAWAEFLCVDRSALSRELGRLKNEGILVCEGNRVILMDKGFLSPS
ncbi:Crp/Fnr family transcriptional regulator [Enterocloster citroniae]